MDVDVEAEEGATPAQLVSPAASDGWSPNVMTYLRKPQAKTKKNKEQD